MTCFAGSRYPRVIFAAPVAQPPSILHSSYSSGPAARWIAPSTPPPPSKLRLAALTMASTASVVISATQISIRVAPTSAMSSAGTSGIKTSLSRPFGLRFGLQIHRALDADIVEMLVQKTPGGAPAADMQHVEEIVVGRKLAEGVEMGAETIEYDAMNVDAAVLPGPGAARQLALVDQAGNEVDGAVFADQRGIERDLVDAIHDLIGRRRRRLPYQRIDLHHQHVLGRGGAEKRKDDRIAEIAAVPIGHAVDLDGAKQERQASRGHHRVGGDLVARTNEHPAGLHIGRRDKNLQIGIGAQRFEVHETLEQILERIDIERVDVVWREIPRQLVEPGLHRRAFERRERKQPPDHGTLQGRQAAARGGRAPEIGQPFLRLITAAAGEAIGQHHR